MLFAVIKEPLYTSIGRDIWAGRRIDMQIYIAVMLVEQACGLLSAVIVVGVYTAYMLVFPFNGYDRDGKSRQLIGRNRMA